MTAEERIESIAKTLACQPENVERALESVLLEMERLRDGGRPWDTERKAVAMVDTDEGPKHLVAACSDAGPKSEQSSFYKGTLLVHCARYIQWLEDELWKYQGVPDEMHDEWNEEEIRALLASREVQTYPWEKGKELAKALELTLKVLDANRTWRRWAEQETTRLGQWNLKLRAARDMVLGRLNRVLDLLRGPKADEEATRVLIDTLVEECLPTLAHTQDDDPDGFVGPWPSLIPPRHLCLWLRDRAGGDLTARAWANEIEKVFGGTDAWRA